jgi:hypothetical protein
MAMSKHLVEVLIRDKKWQPYIESHWIDFGKQKGGSIITFKEHTSFKFKCSNEVANEFLALANKD